MRKLRSNTVAAIVCFGFVLSQPASLLLAANPTNSARSKPVQRDVELTGNGELVGRVVDNQGKPQASKMVVVGRGSFKHRVLTDRYGKFRVRDLRGGSYTVSAERSVRVLRVWNAGTAPPNAKASALIVASDPVIRGQCGTCSGGGDCGGGCVGGYGLYDWISDHPVLSYTLLTAAIAVPIIIAADDDDDVPAS